MKHSKARAGIPLPSQAIALPRYASVCHIVQHVVILHRMWVDDRTFRRGRETAAA